MKPVHIVKKFGLTAKQRSKYERRVREGTAEILHVEWSCYWGDNCTGYNGTGVVYKLLPDSSGDRIDSRGWKRFALDEYEDGLDVVEEVDWDCGWEEAEDSRDTILNIGEV